MAGYSSFSLVRRGTFRVHRGAATVVACPDEAMDELHTGARRTASAAAAWQLGMLACRAKRGVVDDLELEECAASLLFRPGRLASSLAPASRRRVERAKLALLADPG